MHGEAVSYHIGADENGLGPRLGPLLVTAVLASATAEGKTLLDQAPAEALAGRLGDSKALVAHGDCLLGEAWARVLVARGAGKHTRADSPDALADALSLDELSSRTARCPPGHAQQCWRTDGERLSEGEQVDRLMRTLAADLDRLAEDGVHIVAVRSIAVCTRTLNDAAATGTSRLLVDLHAMERLVCALGALAGAPVDAVCGKIGGYAAYGPSFGPLGGRLHTVLEESRRVSRYHFPPLGRVSFVMNADATHPLVALASLVGKYLRELAMARIVHHYRSADPGLPVVSGYHDPRTARFVAQSAPLRVEAGVDPRCFERQARLDDSASTKRPRRFGLNDSGCGSPGRRRGRRPP